MVLKVLAGAAIAVAFTATALAQETAAPARALAVAGGIRVVWQQPQPQPYYYLIYRRPAGHAFPKRVNPNFDSVTGSWIDPGARSSTNYRYRVCSVYSPDDSVKTCTDWFGAGGTSRS